jgi:RNA polymerase sigma-54 factor
VALALAESALAALQACDPPGIGARDTAECLRLQLVDRGLTPEQAVATLAHLPALARQDWAGAGAALGLDPAATQARAALLRGLSPRPVLAQDQPVQALEPDLRATRAADGTVQVAPDSRTLPRLTLDAAMIRRAGDFGADHLARAQAVMAALEQRQSTLARIGDWLARTQPGFFDRGLGALVPASQLDLAEALRLHPSTISRALAGKAVDVDGRLWPLTVFFSRALPATGGAVSSRAVQKRLAEMIRAEDPAAPLSDDAIAEKLRQQGVDIARRTVAKYRQGLRIPPSSTRRRLAAMRPTAGRGG